jgi:hypothetical protein
MLVAAAGPMAAGGGGGVLAGLDAVPAGVSLVLIADDPRGLGEEDVGRALRALAAESGAFDRTADAWADLCEQLGLGHDEAARRLLGGRVFLLVRAEGRDVSLRIDRAEGERGVREQREMVVVKRPGSWALASVVSEETAQLVRRRLHLTPRNILGGQQVSTLPDGSARVVLGEPARDRAAAFGLDRQVAGGRAGVGDVVLIMGSREQPDLFNELASSLTRRPARSAADEPVAQQMLPAQGAGRAGGGSPRALLLTSSNATGLGKQRVLVSASVAEGGSKAVVGGVMAAEEGQPKADGGGEEPPGATPAWSAATFDALAEGSLAALVVSGDGMASAAGVSRAVGDAARTFGLGVAPVLGAADERVALRVSRDDDTEGPAGVSLTLAFETEDRVATLGRFDRGVDQLLANAPGARRGGGAAALPLELNGAFPGSLRTARLSDLLGPVVSARLFGWAVGRADAPFSWTSGPSDLRGADAGGPSSAGWLALGVGLPDEVSRTARALAGADTNADGGAGAARWITMGDVRVRELARTLGGAGAVGAAVEGRDTFAAFERVSWRVLRVDGRMVVGSAEIEVAQGVAEGVNKDAEGEGGLRSGGADRGGADER